MKRFSFKWLALFATTLLFAPACGGDDNGGPSTPKQLNVEASASPEDGSAPLEVTFTATPQFVRGQGDNMNVVNDDISENEDLNLEYSWDFGDDSEAGEGMEATHTYNEPGAYTAEVTLTQTFEGDREDRTATGEVVVNVEAPEFTVSVDSSAEEVRVGEGVTFTCNLDTDLSTDLFDFEWSFDEQGLSASTQETTKSFSTVGAKQVTCEATLGDKTQSGSTSVDVLENPTPTVNALNPNPRTGIASLEVNFNPSVTYGGDKANLSYEWSFGDGGSSTEQAPTYTYENPGSYTATLTVVDPDGDTNSATADIEVTTDEQPAVAIATPSQPVEGISPVTVDFSAEVSGGNQPVDLEWDYGDGSDVDTIDEPTHTFESSDGDSTYTVTVTATDANGDTATDTVDVTAIQDQPINSVTLSPVAAGTDTDTLEPRNVQMECAVDGGNAPFTYEWDFGDGSTKTTQTNTTTHTYTDATAAGGAPFTATCTATDADGDTGSGSEEGIQVTEDTQPSIQAVTANPAQASITANSSVDVDFDSTVSGGNAPLTYEWDFKNGNMGTGATATATYSNAGTYGVQLTVTDNDGDVATDSVTVSIAEGNTPPSADLQLSQNCGYPDYSGAGGSVDATEITIDASGSSDADGDTLTYDYEVIDPNGSSVSSASVQNSPSPTASFTPEMLGEYTIYLTVDDGETTTQAQKTFTSNVNHDVDALTGSITGEIDESPSTAAEFEVTNECGTPLENLEVSFSGDNLTPQTSTINTDSDGQVSTLVTLEEEAGEAILTAETTNPGSLTGTNSYDTFTTEEKQDDVLDSLDTTHTVNAGPVANILIEDRGPIEVSAAVQGQGGQITFQAADRYFNPVEDNSVEVDFTAELRDNSDTDADNSGNLGSVGFLADSGNASDGTTKPLTIGEGEGSVSATIFHDQPSTDATDQVYVTIDNSTIQDGDGNDLPGDNGNFGISAADIDLVSENFEDTDLGSSPVWSSTSPFTNSVNNYDGTNASPTDCDDFDTDSAGPADENRVAACNGEAPSNAGDAGEGDYFETGIPDSGPGSADTGSSVLATNLDGNYDADWDAWNKDSLTGSADDYTETLTATWTFGDTTEVYPYTKFGVHEMDISFSIWYETPTGLSGQSDSAFAAAKVRYLDNAGAGIGDLTVNGIDYTDYSLYGYLDSDSSNNSINFHAADAGANMGNADSSGDYSACGQTTGSTAGGNDNVTDGTLPAITGCTGSIIQPDGGEIAGDWQEIYAGSSDGYVSQTASFESGTVPLEVGSNFHDISGDDLQFAFRTELDERLTNQPSGAGLYVDNIDVDAVVKALPVEFERSTEPGGISSTANYDGEASGASDASNNNALDGFDAIDGTTAGYAEFSIQDDLGNNVGAGVEFTVSITDDGDIGSGNAQFVNEIGEDSNGNDIGSLVSYGNDQVTVATNSNGRARVLVATDTYNAADNNDVVLEGSVTDSNGNNYSAKTAENTGSNVVEFFDCNFTTEVCAVNENLFSGGTSGSGGTSDPDNVRYLEDTTWQLPVDPANWTARLDDNNDPQSDEVWRHELQLTDGNLNNRRDTFAPTPGDFDDDCSSVSNAASFGGADQVFEITPDSATVEAEIRMISGPQGAPGSNDYGMYITTDLENPAENCVTGVGVDDADFSGGKGLVIGDGDGNVTDQTAPTWEPDNTNTHYLVIDSNNDVSSDYSLQLRVDNVE